MAVYGTKRGAKDPQTQRNLLAKFDPRPLVVERDGPIASTGQYRKNFTVRGQFVLNARRMFLGSAGCTEGGLKTPLLGCARLHFVGQI